MIQTITDDRQIAARTIYVTLPDENVDGAGAGETEIDVSNMTLFVFMNSAPVTVTSMRGGLDGRTIRLLGDGQTTIDDNATIVTSTGAPKLLAAKIYQFTHYNGVWYELN